MGYLDRFRKKDTPKPESRPLGTSGRGHTQGFLDLEELNQELRHPHGHRIYDRMYRTDGDIRQVVQLSSNPIISGTWAMVPHGGEYADERDQYVADAVRWALWDQMSPNFPAHLQTMLPVLIRSGFAPFEKAWMAAEYTPKDGESMKMVVPRTLALRLPRTIEQFEQDEFGELTRIKQYLPTSQATITQREGSPFSSLTGNTSPGYVWLDAQNLVYYRMGAEGDNWEGVSLLRPAYKHWKMKDMIERIDAIAQEREAVGVPICYPPLGATTDQLDAMEEVLEGMRTNEQSYIIAPGPKAGKGAPDGQGWLIEVIGYERTGSGRDPQPSLRYHTDKIAAAFIAEFMRLGHGTSGARATAQVQADPFLMSIEALTSIVERVVNEQLVAPIVAYNFPDVKNPPRLQMSLVDSTSLSQLADYVLKLTQVGALLPDNELEAFLRARGDLPPVNPESMRRRGGKKDDDLRREIVTGGGGNGDAYGGNADPGKPHGAKPVSKAASAGKGAANGTTLDADAEGSHTLGVWESPAGRMRWREPRESERHMDYDRIEAAMERTIEQIKSIARPYLIRQARQLSTSDVTPLGEFNPDYTGKDEMRDAIALCLEEAYDTGAEVVRNEIFAMANEHGIGTSGFTLDRGARDRGKPHMHRRAQLAADRMSHEMREAVLNADIVQGEGTHLQLAAEKAGERALSQIAHGHGISAFLHGRHDEAKTLADEDNGIFVIGVRYSAMLDGNTCQACREADDGVVRDLDDPVRLERQPPNPHCHSTRGGFNMCRCVEEYVIRQP